MVVSACESLHVCTVRIWRCEHASFCVEVFYALYINFHSFIHDGNCDRMINNQAHKLCARLALKTVSHSVAVSMQETASQLTDEQYIIVYNKVSEKYELSNSFLKGPRKER